MRAARLSKPGVVEVSHVAIPEPGAGQVLVEMHFASICGSDVHIVFDEMHNPDRLGKPGYPGHEGVGVVVGGESERFPPGTAVLTVPAGDRGGCFAEFQVVDESQLVQLAPGADLRRMLLAQQLGTTIFAMKKFIGRRERPRVAAVIGAGSAGLFFLQQVIRLGCEAVVVSDRNRERLAAAKQFGATETVLAPCGSVVDAVHELTGGFGADLVIEAAGYDACRAEAVEAVREKGTVGLFGYPERRGSSPFPVERCFRKSLTVEWISKTQAESGLASFRAAVERIVSGDIEVDHCLTSMHELDEAPMAMQLARDHGGGAAKVGFVLAAGAAELQVEMTNGDEL
ncbi:zinc-binding dehydrogenase [Saccharopolyspora sp. NPDC049426]|uniref:zinc-binding dehydrogenase n=1 Tax=Saccharopolyspora sp. NPDC049426 TaxID=3155652 RepID=UPI0034393AA2